MGKIAFLFSGQGAQYPGMGKSLCDVSAAARDVFRLADAARPGTSEQCFAGTKEELGLTINTQPCVYCVDLAAAEALCERGIYADVAAGFSLGEVAALTFSKVVTPEQGFDLVCRRGAFMEEAAERTGGGMAAVLKLSNEKVQELCKAYSQVFPVNYNCAGQVAVAGEKAELELFCKDVAAQGGRAVPLAVSGAFHSPFMDSASEQMSELLQNVPVKEPGIPFYSNYTAELYGASAQDTRDKLANQVNHPVLWHGILEKMAGMGVDTFIEVGPGKTLSGLVKKTFPDAAIYRVEDEQTLEDTASALKK